MLKTFYEDEHVIAVEKNAHLFVHAIKGESDSRDNLLIQVRDFCGKYVYPINRIDRPVSGIVLFAKSPEIVREFQTIWHSDDVRKKYLTLNLRRLETPGLFDSSLSKKSLNAEKSSSVKQIALTKYIPLEYYQTEDCTLTEVEILTGRYHQIRRHFRKAIKPILGDTKHGKGKYNHHFKEKYQLDRIFLHSYCLNFNHPISGQRVEVISPLPNKLKNVLSKLKESPFETFKKFPSCSNYSV